MGIDQYAADQYAGRLEQIRRRLAASTPGPWSRQGADVCAAGNEVLFTGRDGSAQIRSQSDADAEFVAHAHADVAVLLHLVTHTALVHPNGKGPSIARTEGTRSEPCDRRQP